eukprot:1201722-Pyramimonas_sp.AAC.1
MKAHPQWAAGASHARDKEHQKCDMPRPQHAQSGEATQHGVHNKHDTARAHCARDKGTEQYRAHCRCD